MTTTTPTHLAHFLDGRPVCWGEHESGDADRTRYPDRVTCDHCKAEVSRSAGMGDAEHAVRVVLKALLATGHRIVPTNADREVEFGRTLADVGPSTTNPDAADEDMVSVPRRVAEYAAAYIGEADHQEALDVASAIESALGGAR